MNRRLASIGAVLRKDAVAYWPFALGTVAIILLRPWYHELNRFELPSTLALGFATVASVFLIIAVVHGDAAASSRHDWLTRPVRRLDLILAKAVYLALVIFLPWLLGAFGEATIYQRLPVGEALLETSGQLIFFALALPVIAFAALTANLVEAIVSIITAALLLAGGVLLGSKVMELYVHSTPIVGSSSGWPLLYVVIVIGAAGSVVTLWLQYRRRRTPAARAVLAGTLLLGLLVGFAASAFGGAFAPAVGKGDPALAGIQLGDPTICRKDGLAKDHQTTDAWLARLSSWDDLEERQAGPSPSALIAGAAVNGLPANWMVSIDRVEGRLSTGLNPPGGALSTNRGPGVHDFQTNWLLTREQAQALPSTAHLVQTVDMQVLKPIHTFSFPDDGKRHHIPGFGWCGVMTEDGAVKALCRKGYPNPAKVEIVRSGQSTTCQINCGDNPMPGWAQLPLTSGFDRQLAGARGGQVQVIVYEHAGRIRRTIDATGVSTVCGPETLVSADERRRIAAFAQFDSDKDGRLNRTEYGALARSLGYAGQEAELFGRRDHDNDGFISATEYRPPLN